MEDVRINMNVPRKHLTQVTTALNDAMPHINDGLNEISVFEINPTSVEIELANITNGGISLHVKMTSPFTNGKEPIEVIVNHLAKAEGRDASYLRLSMVSRWGRHIAEQLKKTLQK